MKNWRKTITVISTFALLLNSLSAPITVLAQTATPEPTSLPTDSPLPTDTATSTPDATVEPSTDPTPSESPVISPSPTTEESASPTPTHIATPTPEGVVEATPAGDLASPTPDASLVVQDTNNENAQSQGPPSDSNQTASQSSASPSITPTATPKVPEKESAITTTVIENIDLSTIKELNSNVDIPTVTTDKADYSPSSVVLITGTGFTADKSYTLAVSSNDEPPVNSSDSVTADSKGTFSYAFKLDEYYRPNYKIEVKDGDFVVASTTFTDSNPASVTYCHETSSNHWNELSTSGEAIIQEGHNGHGDDIIPVFSYIYRPSWCHQSWCETTVNYGGKNLSHDFGSATGQEILDNGCVIPPTGTIKVIKDVFPNDSDATKWDFSISGPTDHTVSLHDGEQSSTYTSNTGNYTITETAHSGTNASNYVTTYNCVNATAPVTSGSGTVASFTLSANQNIVCTFTNTETCSPYDDYGIRSSDGSDHHAIFNFRDDEKNVDVSADSGYTITGVWLDLHNGSDDFVYFGDHAGNYNPSGDTRIDRAKAHVVKTCAPTTGSITVIKDSQPDDLDDITFYLTGSVSDFFNLDDDSDATLPNTDTFTDLTAGTYTVREDYVTRRWTPSTITCSDDNSHGNLPTSPTATINLAAGENVTCTFTNTRNTGTLVVKKLIVGGNDPASNFSFQVDGGTAQPFEADGQNELTVKTFNYTITEPTVPGHTTTYDNCNDVWVETNQTTTCTITNTRNTGNITFEKQISGTQTDPNAWTFNITGTNGNFTAKNGDVKSLPLGTYTITESGGPANYHWSSSAGVCSGPDGSDGILTVTSNGGTCTIVNKRDVSAFTAQKLDENNQPVAGWKFKLNDGAWIETDAQGKVVFSSLETGNYTVTEESRAGSYLSQVTSTGNFCQKIESNNNSATVTVPYSVNPVCVFKNVPIPKYEGSSTCPDDRPVKKLVHSYTIGAQDADGETLAGLTAGNYLFEVLGTFISSSSGGWHSDAGYSSNNNWSSVSPLYGIYGTAPGYGAHALLANLGSGVGIVNWGSYQTNHQYNLYTATVANPQFVIGDRWSNWYGTSFDNQTGMFDNSGKLDLNVYTCEQSPVKVIATKIVCNNEADLPNWGNHGASINADTAQNYVDSHPGCNIQPDWQFQYAPTGGSFGSFQTNVSALSSPWTTFSSAVDIDPTTLSGKIEVREVISDDTYIGFTNDSPTTTNPISAEIYCTGDVYNYDNWEWINNPQPGNTYYCVAFNAKNYGSVTVTKYNDLDQDGEWNNDEPTLDGWNIVLDQAIQPTVAGKTTFSNLTPGSHFLNEELQNGYIQTNIQCFYDDDRAGQFEKNGYFVNVIPGENVQCRIGNFQERPGVSISKTNDKAGGMNAGNTVNYTLTLTNTGNITLNNVMIQDILPGGFTYVDGSTTGAGEPSKSGSVLTWIGFGSLAAGASITIHYQTVSSSDLADGLYTNFATCRVSKGYDNFKAFNVESPEIDCNPTSSTVQIGSGVNFGGGIGGQVLGISTVLGASTELPATGSSNALLIIALVVLGVGLFLRIYDVKITKKAVKKVVRSAKKKGRKHAKK